MLIKEYIYLSENIKPSYTFTIDFKTQCIDNYGNIQIQPVTKTISVPGKSFSPEENSVIISPEGNLNQIVNIRSSSSKTLLLDQPDSQLGNSNWVSSINLTGNFLTFDVAPNYDTYERQMGIKVFVNEYYDPCLAIEDGFTKTYRNIEVIQPSIFKDISVTGELVSKPNFVISHDVRYFSTQVSGDPIIAGYFLANFPLETAFFHPEGSISTSSNIIKGYNVNKQSIWQLNFVL